ncbi:MAG: hypothetical protein HY290_11300 [Planctomycetia bacterium]|nr:hypothetical protein [Planctomycetia bacterium]
MTTILAYFDPGSGSLLVQAVVGGTAGLLVFGKYMWETLSIKLRGSHGRAFGPDVNALSAASSGEIPISQW